MRIAVHGATGYQAGLVLDELNRRGIEPVLIARNPERLAAVHRPPGPGRQESHFPDVAERAAPERRVADPRDPGSLVAALTGCDAVINCAGPFTASGPAVAQAAVAAGCAYVDTAGEQGFVQSLFRTCADAGVPVVPATNDACLPTDLLASLLARGVDQIDEITVTHFLRGGGASRGTLRSLAATADTVASGGLEYRDGRWRPGTPAHATVTLPDGTAAEVIRFPLVEVVTLPRHLAARRVSGWVDAEVGTRLGSPLPDEVIDSLPAGPEPADRSEQRFTYLVDVRGTDGATVRGVVDGPDTYGSTAVIAVEAARRLVADGAPNGVLAPAQAFDPEDFLGFLADHGVVSG